MEITFELPTNPEFIRSCGVAPEVIRENMVLAMRQSNAFIAEYARANHKFISRSGDLEHSIKEEVIIENDDVTGTTFLDTEIALYGPYQHRGTGKWGPYGAPYLIRPVNKKHLRWAGSYGFIWHDETLIKGIHPDPFLFNAADAQETKINQTFADYIDRAIDQVFGKE